MNAFPGRAWILNHKGEFYDFCQYDQLGDAKVYLLVVSDIAWGCRKDLYRHLEVPSKEGYCLEFSREGVRWIPNNGIIPTDNEMQAYSDSPNIVWASKEKGGKTLVEPGHRWVESNYPSDRGHIWKGCYE